MLSRVSKGLFIFGMSALAVLPSMPASAHHTNPPFEVAFPQEVAQTSFSNTWYQGRPGGRRHRGTDLLAPRLTEVYAAADGVVDRIRDNATAGRSIRIAHGDGWTTHYVHLNNDNPGTDDGAAPWSMTVAPGIEEGREVKRGQVIGWVGDSGNAEDTVPHTHFEIRLDGVPMNPYYTLTDAYERDLVAEERLAMVVVRDLNDYWMD